MLEVRWAGRWRFIIKMAESLIKPTGKNAARPGMDWNLENKSEQILLLISLFLCTGILFSPLVSLSHSYLQLLHPGRKTEQP